MIEITFPDNVKQTLKRLKFLEVNNPDFKFSDQMVVAALFGMAINDSTKTVNEIAGFACVSIAELKMSLLRIQSLGLVDYKASVSVNQQFYKCNYDYTLCRS